MPRSLHVPKRATCNFPNRCPATHMSPNYLPNRCPDHYTFPSGRHATFRTDAQITTRSQAGDMQLTHDFRTDAQITTRSQRHATLRTDAKLLTCPQSTCRTDAQITTVPKRATCNFPNRCQDHYTFPSGRHATFRTDAQLLTCPQAGDTRLAEPSALTKRSTRSSSAEQSVGLVKGRLLSGELSLCPPPILLLPLL